MKGSLMILSSFAVGVVLAATGVFPVEIDISNLSGYILYLLMLLVGMSLGLDSGLVSTIKSQPVRMLLLPLSTIWRVSLRKSTTSLTIYLRTYTVTNIYLNSSDPKKL
jgi:uncharacterized membrane protein YbjE (DUF340 family)